MLPLALFKRRNFTVANIETFAMYGGMALQGFFLVLFLQQVAGYSALEAGTANLVPTLMMFAFSRRFGALADRYGPRWFMAVGPFLVAAGFLLMLRLDASTSYFGDLMPALLLYSLGLAVTVAPLTATVLADADESDAGIASAVNNAIARTAGLLVTAAVGAVLATSYASQLDEAVAGQPLSARRPGPARRGARACAQPGRHVRAGAPGRDRRGAGGAGGRREDVPPRRRSSAPPCSPARAARRGVAAQPAAPDRGEVLPRRPVRRRAGGGRRARRRVAA